MLHRPFVAARSFALLVSLLLVACGGGSGGGADSGPVADTSGSPPDLSSADVARDVPGVPDVPGGDVAPDVSEPACEPPGPVPEDTPDPEQTKFALAVFHFNLQYVAGGLEFIDEQGFAHNALPGSEGWGNDEVEDWIIRETFAPVIDFYLEHPEWKVNIELQALMIEVIAARFPELLDKLRTVTQRGQVELMSFHYSDQLFLAFPREDLRRSIAATRALFEQHCLPLAPSVFNQEGQAGEGRQAMLVDEGYQIGVFPKNLWRYQHGDGLRWPYYRSKGGDLIVGPGDVDPASGIEVAWLFFDDGELLAAEAGLDPYFAPIAAYDPQRLEDYEAEIEARVAAGFRIAHVSDYVRHLKARGVEQPEAPPLLDGTWQPPSTDSVHRWLGGRGLVWWPDERDNEVRTGNARDRSELLFAEALRDHAVTEGILPGEVDARLAEGWRALWLAEVSDATGINPWLGEIRYGLNHNAAALAAGEEALAALKDALGTPWALIDTGSGAVTPLDDQPMPEPPPQVDPAFALDIVAAHREVTQLWYHIAPHAEPTDAVPPHFELHLSFGAAPDDSTAAGDPRLIEVGFPRTEDVIRYSPALLEDEVTDYAFDLFAWNAGEFYLPLANGLIGLGDGWWAIKDTRSCHIAARLRPDEPWIRFIDETPPADEAHHWTFLVIQGDVEAALRLANRRNVWPVGVR